MVDRTDSPLTIFPIPNEVGERQLVPALRSLGFRAGRRRAIERRATFYDTQDGRLYRAGVSLAVLEPGALWELRDATGACVARGPGAAEAPAPDGAVAAVLAQPLAGKRLAPVLGQHFRGETVALRGPGETAARLEIGHVTFSAPWRPEAQAKVRVAAVGADYRGGAFPDPAPAFRRLGLEPWPASPVGPALEMLGLPLPGAPVPPAFRVEPADSATAAARKVLGRQAFKMDANTEGAARDLDPEYVHDLRVATRRARAALRVFRGVVERRRAEWFRRELAWLASALGAVRDLDVLAERMRVHSQRVGAPDEVADRIARLLDARRAPAMDVLRRALRSGRYRRVLAALRSGSAVGRGRAAGAAGEVAVLDLAPARIRAASRRVKRALRDGGEQLSAEALHATRIAFKRLRYACEFFVELYGEDVRETIRALVQIQDCLGRHQDAVVAEAVLREILDAEKAVGDADVLVTLGALIQLQREEAGRERERFADLRRHLPRLLKRVRQAAATRRGGPPDGEGPAAPPRRIRRAPAPAAAARSGAEKP